MAIVANDVWTALGSVVVGLSVATTAGVSWLRRNKIANVQASSDIAAIESKDAVIKSWQDLYAGAEQRARDAIEQRKLAESRIDELLSQARADRAEYLRQGREDRKADRAEIEKLSDQVHELTLRVGELTTENTSLKEEINQLATRIGGRRKDDQPA